MTDLIALSVAGFLAILSAVLMWQSVELFSGKPKAPAHNLAQSLGLGGPQTTALGLLALAALIAAQILYHRSGTVALLLAASALCLVATLAFIGMQVQSHRDQDESEA